MSDLPNAGPPPGTPPDDRPYWVAFSCVAGIGPMRFAALLARFGSARTAWSAAPDALGEVLDRRSQQALLAARGALDPAVAVQRVRQLGLVVLTRDDPGYPEPLRQTAWPPFLLYVLGDAALLRRPAVAVVGTREPTRDGRRAAREIAGDLAAAGLVVVSGLARGIDAEAHGAALERGATVAVLGTGPETVYPAANRTLQQRIAREGALVSEYPPGTTAEPGNFPARNRIVSGLCLATVVVEAGARSGALLTAREALDEGRDVLAVPGSIYSPASVGTNQLIGDGAGLCRDAGDVLAALQLPAAVPPPEPEASADPLAAALLAGLEAGPRHIDELARATGLPMPVVARTLALLELSGAVEHLGGMRWSRRGPTARRPARA
jgi:DNA processing protein